MKAAGKGFIPESLGNWIPLGIPQGLDSSGNSSGNSSGTGFLNEFIQGNIPKNPSREKNRSQIPQGTIYPQIPAGSDPSRNPPGSDPSRNPPRPIRGFPRIRPGSDSLPDFLPSPSPVRSREPQIWAEQTIPGIFAFSGEASKKKKKKGARADSEHSSRERGRNSRFSQGFLHPGPGRFPNPGFPSPIPGIPPNPGRTREFRGNRRLGSGSENSGNSGPEADPGEFPTIPAGKSGIRPGRGTGIPRKSQRGSGPRNSRGNASEGSPGIPPFPGVSGPSPITFEPLMSSEPGIDPGLERMDQSITNQ